MGIFDKIRNKVEDKRKDRNDKSKVKTLDRTRDKLPSKSEVKDFTLIKAIKKSPLYGKSGSDDLARKVISEDLTTSGTVLPGELILFKYFEPIHKEELEYYDASPCTIFFGVYTPKGKGKHIVGFNIHYYPPKIRYQVMNRIFEIYRPLYERCFDGSRKKVADFDFRALIQQLQRAKLDFGIREYDLKLCKDITQIPPKYWQVAVFTEGWFKKRTREAIMNYWKNFNSAYGTPKQKKKTDKKEKGS